MGILPNGRPTRAETSEKPADASAILYDAGARPWDPRG